MRQESKGGAMPSEHARPRAQAETEPRDGAARVEEIPAAGNSVGLEQFTQ